MDNNNKSGGNFVNGFLLGALVGAAIVFLFGTKKGKRLLKAISEEGMENISSIFEKANNSVDLDEVMDDEESSFAGASADKSAGKEVKPKIRRFFRGASKRFN